MARWLAAVVVVVAVAGWCAAAAGGSTLYTGGNVQIFYNGSEIMAETLRRQLMKDNYDYIATESEEPEHRLPAEQNRSNEQVLQDKVIVATVLDGEDRKKDPIHEISNQEKKKNKKRRNLFQKLINRRMKIYKHMYGADEVVDKRYSSRYRYNTMDDGNSVADHDVDNKSTLRRPSRRSGQAATLIQEQSPQGVALVKLGGGPVPPFRLPGPRRQYMAALGPLAGAAGDEPDLPPPALDDGAPAEPDPAAHTTKHPQPYFNNGKDSLKITVTPDEIFVL